MKKMLVFLWLNFLISCSPSNSHSIEIENDHKISLSSELSNDPIARSQITASSIYTIKTWESLNGRLPGTLIIVLKTKPIDLNGTEVNGLWLGGKVIKIWAGNFNETPALYHELCHRAFLLPNHSHFKWGQWDSEGNACYKQILLSRESH